MKYSVISFLLTIGTCIIMLLKAMGSVLDFWAVLKMCTAPFTGKASGGTNKSCSLSQYSPCQGGTQWDHHVYWPFPHLRPQSDHSMWGLTVCPGDTAWPLSVWLGELLMTFYDSTRASHVALVGELPATAGDIKTLVWPVGQEDPLEEGMATHSGILA